MQRSVDHWDPGILPAHFVRRLVNPAAKAKMRALKALGTEPSICGFSMGTGSRGVGNAPTERKIMLEAIPFLLLRTSKLSRSVH